MGRAVDEAVGPDRDAAIADFRRRVLGWANPKDYAEMTREQFDAEVPPIDPDSVPLAPPEIFMENMAEEPDDRPIAVAGVLLLKGMPAFGMRVAMMRAIVLVSVEVEAAVKARWSDMDFKDRVLFAGSVIRERLYLALSGAD